MVSNYQGVRATPKKEAQLVQVKDYMAKNLVTFTPEQSIEEVINVLLKKDISGAPVVDSAGTLVGVISEGDCLKEVVKGKYNDSLSRTGSVAEYMSHEVASISGELNIFEAAQLFLEKKYRRFPVLSEEGNLIGQISQKDVLRAVDNVKNSTWR